MNLDVSATVYSASTWVVPILIAITFHEAAHAFAAWVGIIFVLPMLGRQIGVNLDVFRWLVGVPLAWLAPMFFRLAGVGAGG